MLNSGESTLSFPGGLTVVSQKSSSKKTGREAGMGKGGVSFPSAWVRPSDGWIPSFYLNGSQLLFSGTLALLAADQYYVVVKLQFS